jgi:hypothetical protein
MNQDIETGYRIHRDMRLKGSSGKQMGIRIKIASFKKYIGL